MLRKLTSVGAATIVGVGLVVAVTEPTGAPHSFTSDVQLTTTVLGMCGLGYETVGPDLMARVLGGRFANEEALVGLPWPGEMAPWNGTLTLDQSVAVGLENMDAAIRNTPGPKIGVGASGTTLVVDEVMRRLADDPNAPPADELSCVVLGDANRGVFKQFRGITLPIFEYTVPAIPVTKYDLIVVKGQYDGLGDWPDHWWNLLAVANAMAGSGMLQQVIPEDIVAEYRLEDFGSVHYDAMFADLTQVPRENITTTRNAAGGLTTTYLIPTADLPLLRPLKNLGVPPDVIDNLEKVLRPMIDIAYVRTDPHLSGTTQNPYVPKSPSRPMSTAARPATPARLTAATPAAATSKVSGRAGTRRASVG